MNRKQRMAEEILLHGMHLKRIFNVKDVGPVTLSKKVHRIETRAHHIAETYCNVPTPADWIEEQKEKVMNALDRILNFRKQDIPVFFNHDPRGYALKIQLQYTNEHNLEIHKDWGGYGIIAPEFDGRE